MGNANSHHDPIAPGDDEEAVLRSIEDDAAAAAEIAHETAGPASPASAYESDDQPTAAPRSPSFRPSPSPPRPSLSPPWSLQNVEEEERPRFPGPAPEDLDSPDLLPPGQIPEVLAQAIPRYVRPRQPNRPIPAPGQDDVDDDEVREQQAWISVFNAQGLREVHQAIRNYLHEANGLDFLRRIADIHGEDEIITRRRFGRRYLDDAPWRDNNGIDNIANMTLTLRRILMDEVDLPFTLPATAEEVRSAQQGATSSRAGDLDSFERMSKLLSSAGAGASGSAVFRQTHGQVGEYQGNINAFFYRDEVTEREETYGDLTNLGTAEMARAIVTWTQNSRMPIRLGAGRARASDRTTEKVAQRLSHPRLNEFREGDDLFTPENSFQDVLAALNPPDDRNFRWGLLYVRILRHIELFGAREALARVGRFIPDYMRTHLSRRGPDAVLRLGYMRTGEASLAALIADWTTFTRGFRLPVELRGARREGAVPPVVPEPDDDTVSRRFRVRQARGYERTAKEERGRLEALKEELAQAREAAEDARTDAELARIALEALREEQGEGVGAEDEGFQCPICRRMLDSPDQRDDCLAEHRAELHEFRRRMWLQGYPALPDAEVGEEGVGAASREGGQDDVLSERDASTRPPSEVSDLLESEESEDELALPTSPPRPHGPFRARPASFQSMYDVTPERGAVSRGRAIPRGRGRSRGRGSSLRTARKRARSSNAEDPSSMPSGRRRRVATHVEVPVLAAPQAPTPPVAAPPVAVPPAAQPTTTGTSRVTRSRAEASKAVLDPGL